MDRRMDDAEWTPENAGRWEPEDPENHPRQNYSSTTTAQREAVSPSSSQSHQAWAHAVPRTAMPRNTEDILEPSRVQQLFPHLTNNEAQLRAALATCEKYKSMSYYDPGESPKTSQSSPPSSSKEHIPPHPQPQPQPQPHPRGQASLRRRKDQRVSSRTPRPVVSSSASQWSDWSWNTKHGYYSRSRPRGKGYDWEYEYPLAEEPGNSHSGLTGQDVSSSQPAGDDRDTGSKSHGKSSTDTRSRRAPDTETDSKSDFQKRQGDRKLKERPKFSSGVSSSLFGTEPKTASIQNDVRGKDDTRAEHNTRLVDTVETRLENLSLGTASSLSQQGYHQASIHEMPTRPLPKKGDLASNTSDQEVYEDSSVILTDSEVSLGDAGSEDYEFDRGDDWDDSSETFDDDAIHAAMLHVFKRPDLISALREIYAVVQDRQASLFHSGAEVKKCAGGTNRSGSRSRPGGIRTANQKNSTGPRKRRAIDQNDDGDGEGQRQPGSPGIVPSFDTAESKASRFACPYQKYAPDQFLEGACVRGGFKDIPKVKEHLYRRHQRWYLCQRCKRDFNCQSRLDEHVREIAACQYQERKLEHGLSIEQYLLIKDKAKSFTGQKEKDKWEEIYQYLFPSATVVPSPFFNTPEQPLDAPLKVRDNFYSAETKFPSIEWDPVTNSPAFAPFEMTPVTALPGTNQVHTGSSIGVGNDPAECFVAPSRLSDSGLDNSMVCNGMISSRIAGWGNAAGSYEFLDGLDFDKYPKPPNMMAQSYVQHLPQNEIDTHIYRPPMDTHSSEPSGACYVSTPSEHDPGGEQSSRKGKGKEIEQPVASPEVTKLMQDPDLKTFMRKTFSIIEKVGKRMDALEKRLDG